MAHLVHHEQQTELVTLAVNILLNVGHQLGDAQFVGLLAIEPVAGSLLAHAQDGLEHLYHIVLKESEGVTGLHPGAAIYFFKLLPEFLRFALPVNKTLQLGNFQVISVETAVIVKHLGKGAENSGLILVDRSFNVNIEQNGFCGNRHAFDRLSVHHRVIKFIFEVVNGWNSLHLFVREQVGKHLQKVRFTASKKAGDPHTHFIRGLINGLGIVIKESPEMAAQLLGNDVLAQFLMQALFIVLSNLNDTINITVDIFLEHGLNLHIFDLPHSRLNAR